MTGFGFVQVPSLILILKAVVAGCQVGLGTRRESRYEIQRPSQSVQLIRLLDKQTCPIIRRNFTRRSELNIQTSKMPLENLPRVLRQCQVSRQTDAMLVSLAGGVRAFKKMLDKVDIAETIMVANHIVHSIKCVA